MSLVPDFILGPRKVLDFGELQQPGRRGTTRFFGTGSGADGLGSLGYQVWSPGPQMITNRRAADAQHDESG